MDRITIQLKKNGKKEVIINRKKVKNVRLKVFPDCKVSMTVPENVSDIWIKDFLEKKSRWIDSKITQFTKTLGVLNVTELKSGTSIKLLGIDTLVIIREANRKTVSYDDGKLFIDTLDLKKQHIIQEQLEKYMKDRLINVAEKKMNELFYIIKKEGYDYPQLYIRKMKTMWGNCNPKKNKITINFYLYQASSTCIEYVLLHELLHFIHPNHSKEFYELLFLYMPDWEERKQKLDYDVISYIS